MSQYYPDNKAKQRHQKKTTVQTNIPYEWRQKIPQLNTNKLNPQYIKKMIYSDQVGFILRMQV